jgi:cbb3-type cytochrome oxidase maturation protein
MMWSMLLLIILTLAAGFAGWILFLWAVKSGQYDDIEGPKYRMLDDDEEVIKKTDRENDKRPDIQREEPD